MANTDYIFLQNIMNSLDLRHYKMFDNISNEYMKQIQPFTILRRFSIVPDQSGLSIYQLLVAQEFNNKIPNAKTLYLKMLASAGNGRQLSHSWIKPVSKKKSKDALFTKLQELLDTNDIETKIILKNYNTDQIIGLLHQFGLQDSEIDQII